MNVYQVGPNQFAVVWNADKVVGAAALERSDHDHEGFVVAADVTGLSTYTDEPSWVWLNENEVGDPGKIRSVRNRTWYYRIVHEGGVIGPAHVQGKPDGIALEVARLAARHLERDVQNDAYLIRKPTYGERCATCWDAVRQQRVRTNCDACDGSGYQRGWGSATHLYVSFAIDKAQPEQLNTMRFNQLQLPMWTGSTPVITVGDYILRRNDLELFEVVRWQPTIRRGFIIRQNIMGRQLEKNNGLYNTVADIVGG